jgi:hypothetical protein
MVARRTMRMRRTTLVRAARLYYDMRARGVTLHSIPCGSGAIIPRRRQGMKMLLTVDIPPSSPSPCLKFNADCRFRIAMSPEELEKAGRGKLGKRWA